MVDGKKIFSYVLMAIYAIWLIWMIVNNAYLISYPYPIEYREGHSLSSTMLMMQGISPYTLDTYPEYYNSYGILFNILMLPFVCLFGPSLVVCRIVNELCVISIILLLLFYKRKSQRWEIVLAAICNFYIFYHINTNVSIRPDGLGTLLYIASIVIPLRSDFSKKSLIVSAILSVLAFYTKPYFILGWYLVSLVLLFKNWRHFIIANIKFHTLFLLICIGMNKIFPLYFYETIFAYRRSFGSMYYSLNQMLMALKRMLPMLFVVGVGCYMYIRKKHIFPWSSILIIFASSILLIYPLGTNDGAYLTYHTQLLSSLLLMVAIDNEDIKCRYDILFQLCLLMFSLYAFMKIPMMHRSDETGWTEIESYVSESDKIYNDPGITPLLLLNSKPVTDDGVSVFACDFEYKPLTNCLFGKDSVLLNAKTSYKESIISDFNNSVYDCVIIGENEAEENNRWMSGYKCVDAIDVVFPCNNWPFIYYVYQRVE